MDTDLLVVLLVAVDGEKEISYQASEDLNHQAVFASGDKVIDPEVSLPPAEEFLYLPAELVNHSNLFC